MGVATLEDRVRVSGVKPDALYVTPQQASVITGISYKKLEAMRARREGPCFLKVGSRVVYARAALIAWMESHRIGGAA